MLQAKEGYRTTSSSSSRTENVFVGIIKCNTTYLEGVKINHSVNTKMEADLLLNSPKITILPSLGTKDCSYSFNATRLNVGSRVVFCHVLLPDGTTVNLQLILSFPNHHHDFPCLSSDVTDTNKNVELSVTDKLTYIKKNKQTQKGG